MTSPRPAASAPRPAFSVRLRTRHPADVAWARLWDLDRHTAAIPFTRVGTDDGGPLAEGSRLTARTALGPWGFDDRMVLRSLAPSRAVVEKVGPWLRGRIDATVHADGAGSIVTWEQTYGARGVPRLLAAPAGPLLRLGYAAGLRRILG